MIIPKTKRIKLRGKAKHELRQAIFSRDKFCIVCGCQIDNEWHHEPCGIGKSDEIEKGVRLCRSCHRQRHDGPNSIEIRQICEWYLQKTYCKEPDKQVCRECGNLLCFNYKVGGYAHERSNISNA